MMLAGFLTMSGLVLVPFFFASARYVIVRAGRPAWLARRLAARAPRTGFGAGAAVTEEMHAFYNSNKRVTQEQRQEELTLRADGLENGAPRRTGIDLDAGTARITRRPSGA